jgi:hypothetical protein
MEPKTCAKKGGYGMTYAGHCIEGAGHEHC